MVEGKGGEEKNGLRCDTCREGFADCECPISAELSSELTSQISELRAKPVHAQTQKTKRLRLRVWLAPGLWRSVDHWADVWRVSTSRALEALLRQHSGRDGEALDVFPGKRKPRDVTLDGLTITRLKARASAEGVSVSCLVAKRLRHELVALDG